MRRNRARQNVFQPSTISWLALSEFAKSVLQQWIVISSVFADVAKKEMCDTANIVCCYFCLSFG